MERPEREREREKPEREREIRLDTRLVSNTPFSVGGVIRGMRALRPGCDIGTQSYGYMRVSPFRSLSRHALGTDTEGVAERVRTPVAPPGHSRLNEVGVTENPLWGCTASTIATMNWAMETVIQGQRRKQRLLSLREVFQKPS